MTESGRFDPNQIRGIDLALTEFERGERAKRGLEAAQLTQLADALDIALGADGSRVRQDGAGAPGGEVGPRAPARDRAAGRAPERELAYRSLRLEVAALLHESEAVAERLLQAAYDAKHHFRETLVALSEGEISLNHLKTIANEGCVLTAPGSVGQAERLAAYERAVLDIARVESPNRLRPVARRLAAAHSQETVEQQHERAAQKRCIRVVDAGDGMSDLIAHLPAPEAHAIFDRVARVAKKLATVAELPAGSQDGGAQAGGAEAADAAIAGASRSVAAVRADVFCDLLLGRVGATAGAASGIDGHIQLVVPSDLLEPGTALNGARESGTESGFVGGVVGGVVRSLAPAAGGPERLLRGQWQHERPVAELIGHGPIDAGTARELAVTASGWELVSIDVGGTVLSVNRYRPTPQMRRLLGARDLHCRAPGCRVPAHRCDIDHTRDAALGGETSTTNLAHLCRGHHVLKHHTDWQVSQQPNGDMNWVSPTGRSHRDRPASRVRFRAGLESQLR